jgi:molecular chaperone DnaK
MVKEAESHADDDRKKRELVDARNQLDGLAYQTEKTLAEHGAALDAGTRGGIETALADAKKALEAQDIGQIRSATEALSRASHKLAEAVYAKASQGGQPGGEAPRPDGSSDGQAHDKDKEDVVEAEFEEVKE